MASKDIVIKYHGHRVITNEISTNNEGLSKLSEKAYTANIIFTPNWYPSPKRL